MVSEIECRRGKTLEVTITAHAGGKMMLNVIGAFAQFERDLLIDRTKTGLNRAKAQGKTLRRPKSLSDKQKEEIRPALANGETI